MTQGIVRSRHSGQWLSPPSAFPQWQTWSGACQTPSAQCRWWCSPQGQTCIQAHDATHEIQSAHSQTVQRCCFAKKAHMARLRAVGRGQSTIHICAASGALELSLLALGFPSIHWAINSACAHLDLCKHSLLLSVFKHYSAQFVNPSLCNPGQAALMSQRVPVWQIPAHSCVHTCAPSNATKVWRAVLEPLATSRSPRSWHYGPPNNPDTFVEHVHAPVRKHTCSLKVQARPHVRECVEVHSCTPCAKHASKSSAHPHRSRASCQPLECRPTYRVFVRVAGGGPWGMLPARKGGTAGGAG